MVDLSFNLYVLFQRLHVSGGDLYSAPHDKAHIRAKAQTLNAAVIDGFYKQADHWYKFNSKYKES